MRIWHLGCIMTTLLFGAEPEPTPPPADGRPTVVVFGDSTTARRKGVRQVYEQRLAKRLPGIILANAGVPGDTTERARARFARDVLSRQPDVVVVQFGANDSAVDVWKGATAPRVSQERYAANLRHFIDELQKRDCRVVLMTPGVFRWTDKLRGMYGKPPYQADQPEGFCVTLREYAEITRRLARELHLPLVDVYAAQMQYDAKPGQSVDSLFLDGMHPNDRGHELIADLLGPVLRRLLGRPPEP
jgi:lysophospholipase L1-like esterase